MLHLGMQRVRIQFGHRASHQTAGRIEVDRTTANSLSLTPRATASTQFQCFFIFYELYAQCMTTYGGPFKKINTKHIIWKTPNRLRCDTAMEGGGGGHPGSNALSDRTLPTIMYPSSVWSVGHYTGSAAKYCTLSFCMERTSELFAVQWTVSTMQDVLRLKIKYIQISEPCYILLKNIGIAYMVYIYSLLSWSLNPLRLPTGWVLSKTVWGSMGGDHSQMRHLIVDKNKRHSVLPPHHWVCPPHCLKSVAASAS